MSILVLNSGSSSLKIKVFADGKTAAFVAGNLEKIGEEKSILTCKIPGETVSKEFTCKDHQQGLQEFLDILRQHNALSAVRAIGHRVVHGGEYFSSPVLIDDAVVEGIQKNISLAPLHNPANLKGIEATKNLFPDTPQVAVFDTAFHQTLPPHAYHYALPISYYENDKIRRYGFHGTSHQYVAQEACTILGKDLAQTSLITVHLGNGASITAIENGKSVETSMGMTPLEGLIMGTRSGDIDPGVVLYLLETHTKEELNTLLNKKSGLRGICGTNDMRNIEATTKDNDLAKLALEMATHRIKKYIGAYTALLPQLAAIVFTAGIGENSPCVREKCTKNLDHLGISLCETKNVTVNKGEIQSEKSRVKILIIPTDEEMAIAQQTMAVIGG